MREILFKAKRVSDKEWVEGFYVNNYLAPTISTPCYNVEIDPETLCEFAGRRDKNGKKMFEGDIVNCVSRTDEARMVIIFEEGEFRMVPVERFNDYSTGAGYYAIRCFEKEVIGNIYDNPELLKEE